MINVVAWGFSSIIPEVSLLFDFFATNNKNTTRMSSFKKAKQRWKPTMTRSFQRSELEHAEICGAQSWWGFLIRFSRVHHEVRTGFWSRNGFDNIYIHTLPKTNLAPETTASPQQKTSNHPFFQKKNKLAVSFRGGEQNHQWEFTIYCIKFTSNGSMHQGKIKILTSWFTTIWCKKNIENCWT